MNLISIDQKLICFIQFYSWFLDFQKENCKVTSNSNDGEPSMDPLQRYFWVGCSYNSKWTDNKNVS
jgi:hypothetical protein